MSALGPESDLIMPCLPTAYKGPAIIMVVGGTFSLLGAIPVSITMALEIRSSATIIGLGFMGFGMMLIIPGLCWCMVINYKRCPWRRRRRLDLEVNEHGPEATPALREKNQSQYGVENEADEITDALKPRDSDPDHVTCDVMGDKS